MPDIEYEAPSDRGNISVPDNHTILSMQLGGIPNSEEENCWDSSTTYGGNGDSD